MKDFLIERLGADNVLVDPEVLNAYSDDSTEADPATPSVVAFVTTVVEIQAIVKEAARLEVPLTARVAGTNVGGLTIPSDGGIVLDLSRMNRVISIEPDDMVAVIEPGVTQQGLKDHIARQDLPLTFGFSLAPPHTSVLANALLGGLTNRSLKYGDQSEWISGLEAVRGDGSLLRTGSWALSDVPFARMPFPDLTGLFAGWQGTTGIVTKMAFRLWPKHPIERRYLLLCYDLPGVYAAMRKLCRAEICDDIGGLSWPSAKMMLGVPRPDPNLQAGEPHFFLYLDLTAETAAEMDAKLDVVKRTIRAVEGAGSRFEPPIEVDTLVHAIPQLSMFSEFPMDLEFLTQPPGAGLTWVGTYGPMSRVTEAARAVEAIMIRHDTPPLIVSRAMRGGHFVVLRMITTFDKSDPADVERVKSLNQSLLDEVTHRGFVMYKSPVWAWHRMAPQIDPGMRRLMGELKVLLDPAAIFNPGKLGL